MSACFKNSLGSPSTPIAFSFFIDYITSFTVNFLSSKPDGSVFRDVEPSETGNFGDALLYNDDQN